MSRSIRPAPPPPAHAAARRFQIRSMHYYPVYPWGPDQHRLARNSHTFGRPWRLYDRETHRADEFEQHEDAVEFLRLILVAEAIEAEMTGGEVVGRG